MMSLRLNDLLNDKTLHVYHAKSMPMPDRRMSFFALTDALINQAGAYDKPALYFWPTDRLIFLGMLDTKLPYFKEALAVFEEADYPYIVRNSGGLGVVSDPGVINFSLTFKNDDLNTISIDQAYELMKEVVDRAIGLETDAIEIPNSYCPGDFDLSIDGKKIAGISQRRRANATSVMIYISINGDQDKRSNLMRAFYQAGLQGEDSKWDFPDVKPEVMTTLSKALGQEISLADFEKRILQVVNDLSAGTVEGDYTEEIQADYDQAFQQMIRRNQKMLGDKFKKEGTA